MGLSFSFLKPKNKDEMKLVLGIATRAAQKYGKPTPEIKQRVQSEINQAITETRRSGSSQNRSVVPQNIMGPLEGHDFSDLMLRPPSIDKSIIPGMGEVEKDYGNEMHSAYSKAAVPWEMGDMSTLEKVAGGAGAAAALLGLLGVGGRKARGNLAAVSKRGLGYAMGSPERYRRGQERDLVSDSNLASSKRHAAMAPLQAGQDQFNHDLSNNQDAYTRDVRRAGLLKDFSSMRQSENELDFRKRGGGGSKIPYDKQLYFDALKKIDEQGYTYEQLSPGEQAAYRKYGPRGDTDPSQLTPLQLRNVAEDEFGARGESALTDFVGHIKEGYPDIYDDWESGTDGIEALRPLIDSGDIGRKVDKEGWFTGDDIFPDTIARNLLDTASHYNDVGNLSDYQTEKLGDTSWVNAQNALLSPKSKAAWSPNDVGIGKKQLPDWAIQKGFKTHEEAVDFAVSVRDEIGEEAYREVIEQLGFTYEPR